MIRAAAVVGLLAVCVLEICRAKDWETDCERVRGCSCKWASGKKEANCRYQGFQEIPTHLSEEIQVVILDGNNFTVLEGDVFNNAKLINVHKLSLQNCSIEVIEKSAFAKLLIMIELDLSHNQIRKLDATTFAFPERLRILDLSNNLLEKLEGDIFSNMVYLQNVNLDNNRITQIEPKAFSHLPAIKSIKLNGNSMNHIKLSIFEKYGSTLSSLEIKNNPWKCNCHLRSFMAWYTEKLYTDPTTCAEPDYLQNRTWKSIRPEEFACKPEVLWLTEGTVLDGSADSVTLSCRVNGDPRPEAHWTFNARPLDNSTALGSSPSDRKYTSYESSGNTFWVNVTISNVSRQDYGTYICVARNPAGLDDRNVTISVSGQVQIFGITRTNISDVWVLLLCIFIGIVCALILIFLLCFVCCRRAENLVPKKPPNISINANGDITHHIVIEPEQQKTLLTAVNPVQKPPRKYDSSPQSDNGGAELTELNRNLLDDSSCLGGTSLAGDSIEERRSTNSAEHLSSCNSQDNLLLQERLRPLNRSHHPPDLLAFPNRRITGSPAGSIVSNDADGARFRVIHSPVRSPIYQMHPYTPSYETLPYSRTQSPFSPTSATPVIQHRQGYVTIPRRPRVPSWSSAPTPTIEEALNKTEPVYDNLGPRTTADGSSVLSLTRKVAAESPNMRSRPLPPAPLYTSHTLPHKSKLNHVYLSIRENEEPQFHAIGLPQNANDNGGVIRPLPLQCSPSAEASRSWTTRPQALQGPENGTLKKNGDVVPSKSVPAKSKVPPKPPPKPKKNGPLFEDEGEDGTEV